MKKLLLFILPLLLLSCSALKKGKDGGTTSKKKTPENQEQITDLTVTDQFLQGKRAMYTGDFSKALAHFNRCIKENPQHAASRYEISRIYELKQNYKESAKWSLEAYALEQDNIWYLRNSIEQLKKLKDYKKAAELMQALIDREPKEKQNYYDLANLYIYAKEYSSALKVYEDIERKFGFEEGVVLQRKQIYLNQKKPKEALREVEILIKHFPEKTKYLGMKGHILNMQGKHNEALEVYKHILKVDPNDGKVHLAMASLYFSQNEKDKAFEEEIIAFRNEDLEVDLKVKTVMKYLSKDNLAKPEESHLRDLLRIFEEVHPEEPKALAVNGDFFAKKKLDKQALAYYKRVLKLDSSKYVIWEQVVLLYNEQKNFDAVQNYSQRALLLFPQHSALYFFSALASFELKDYPKTVEACEIGLNFTYAPAQQIDFILMSARAYIAMKKFDKALEQLEQISYIKANVPEALAEKALCLALQGDQLSEAELDIKSALELDYTNRRYMYIYARVLSGQNKHTEAKHWIDKACANASEADYFELAGDIYHKLLEKEKAHSLYTKAIELGGNKTLLQQKINKI